MSEELSAPAPASQREIGLSNGFLKCGFPELQTETTQRSKNSELELSAAVVSLAVAVVGAAIALAIVLAAVSLAVAAPVAVAATI